jgi:tRNA modification GTPase
MTMPVESTSEDHAPLEVFNLTPPAMGGVAVVQVRGKCAFETVSRFLEANSPATLNSMASDRLRLCRWCDGEEVVDDALIAVGWDASGNEVVDVNLHGGPRVVQRVLMMLAGIGARIMPTSRARNHTGQCTDQLESAMIATLPNVATRSAATWLIANTSRLREQLESIQTQLQAGQLEGARTQLQNLLAGSPRARWVIKGCRIVLAGSPNAGKSTLANALARTSQALTHAEAGTTRDWVDHPGAIAGLPCWFVDTAGLGPTSHAIDIEASKKAQHQIETADLILWVVDASLPPGDDDQQLTDIQPEQRQLHSLRRILVLNKSDLSVHPHWRNIVDRSKMSTCLVSAESATGLDNLRTRILSELKMTDWADGLVAAFSPEVEAMLHDALNLLDEDEPGADRSQAIIASMLQPG